MWGYSKEGHSGVGIGVRTLNAHNTCIINNFINHGVQIKFKYQ